MEKATTLNVRVNPMVKARAEEVLSKLAKKRIAGSTLYTIIIKLHNIMEYFSILCAIIDNNRFFSHNPFSILIRQIIAVSTQN